MPTSLAPKHSSTVSDTSFSGQDTDGDRTNGFSNGAVGFGTTGGTGLTNATNPAALNPEGGQSATTYPVGQGMRTDDAEGLGGTGTFNEMAFSIEKVTVTAKSRALKARVQFLACSGLEKPFTV